MKTKIFAHRGFIGTHIDPATSPGILSKTFGLEDGFIVDLSQVDISTEAVEALKKFEVSGSVAEGDIAVNEVNLVSGMVRIIAWKGSPTQVLVPNSHSVCVGSLLDLVKEFVPNEPPAEFVMSVNRFITENGHPLENGQEEQHQEHGDAEDDKPCIYCEARRERAMLPLEKPEDLTPLTAENVEYAMRYCLFKNHEDTSNHTVGEGFTKKCGLHPERLKEMVPFLKGWLEQLNPEYILSKTHAGHTVVDLIKKVVKTVDGNGNPQVNEVVWNDHIGAEMLYTLLDACGFAHKTLPMRLWDGIPNKFWLVGFSTDAAMMEYAKSEIGMAVYAIKLMAQVMDR